MNPKTLSAFIGGVALTALVAAVRLTGGTPLDQAFTYQGQLRNAGQLVNGPVDLRITMWDSEVGGAQVGSANSFNAIVLNEGRFACGLSFGSSAFDGSNRWIQVEFRNPAGSGQYLALSPRDKVTAAPYALYALNGANGVWVNDTSQQSVSVLGRRVGIGTSAPTAVLEVSSPVSGDGAVVLPHGSIGPDEIAPAARTAAVAAAGTAVFSNAGYPGGYLTPVSKAISAPASGILSIVATTSDNYNTGELGALQIVVDGVVVAQSQTLNNASPSAAASVPVSAGDHSVVVRYAQAAPGCPTNCVSYRSSAAMMVVFTPEGL